MTDTSSPPVLLHTERTADPDRLHWAVPGRTLPSAERIRQRLLNGAGIVDVERCSDGYTVTKEPPASWSELAPAVEAAIRVEVPAMAEGTTRVEVPTIETVRAVIEASVGPLLAAHGGRIDVVDVSPGRISLAMHGACAGCPGSTGTIDDVVVVELRRRFPSVTTVPVDRGRRRLGPLGWRRNRS